MVVLTMLLAGATIFYSEYEYTNIAAMMPAFALGIYLEKKTTDFEPKGKPVKQLIKLLIGLGGVAVLLVPFELLLPEAHLLTFAGYFLVGLWLSFFAPYLFVKLKLSKSMKEELP